MKEKKETSCRPPSFISTFGCSSAARGVFPFPLVSYVETQTKQGIKGKKRVWRETKGTLRMSHSSIGCTKLDEVDRFEFRVPSSTFVKLNLVVVE